MPQFQYTARRSTGELVAGMLSVGTRQEALRSLSAQALLPVQLQEAAAVPQRRRRVPVRLQANLYEQLGDLLGSGTPLLKSLQILRDQTTHPGLGQILDELLREVADGRPLHKAMHSRPEVFSNLAVNLVQAGEEGGFLEDSLQRIAQFTERQEELRSRVVGALVYPLFLLVVGTLVTAGMLAFFVPQFTPLFERMQARGTLPWPTVALLGVSDLLKDWGLLLVVAAIGLAFAIGQALRQEVWQLRRDVWSLRLPICGPLVRSLALARFCRVLGTLLTNGVPLLRSLEIARGAAGNRVLQTAIREAGQHVSEGKSLAAPLARSGVFPRDVLEMIAVGETSSRLETVLVDLADKLERRAQRKIDSLVKLLEPCLMLVMALVVGFLVVALLMPVFEGSGGF